MGQAGVQMASACWELYCMEHAIGKDGQIIKDRLKEDDNNAILPGCDAFFSVTEGNRYVPRAILADLEPTVIGEQFSLQSSDPTY